MPFFLRKEKRKSPLLNTKPCVTTSCVMGEGWGGMSHKAIIFQETAGLESPNHAGGFGSTAGETRPAQACGRAGYV